MDYEKAIPLIGGGTTAVLLFNQLWLVGGAFVLVMGSALLIRWGFRRGKSPWDAS
jgi:hypothetical protein